MSDVPTTPPAAKDAPGKAARSPRRYVTGTVVSAKMAKTISVQVR